MPDRLLHLDDFWTQLVSCHNDLPQLLRVVANRVVELVGDGCVLTMVAEDGATLRPEVVRHTDQDVEVAMRAVLADAEVRVGDGLAGTAAADRRAVVINDLTPETTDETTPLRFLPFVHDHPMRAVMIVPMIASGVLVGTLGAVRTESVEPYSADDLRVLEALAERAALAMQEAVSGPRVIGVEDIEAVYRHNLDGVLLATPDGHILAANPAACSMLRMSERDVIAAGREGIVQPDDPRSAVALAERAATGRARTELTMRRSDGSTFEAAVSSLLYTSRDHGVRAVVIFRDIDDQVHARNTAVERIVELERAATRDPLTGLLNRRGLQVAADHAFATADREGAATQLVFLDVDGLKVINDEMGHSAGDDALRSLADALCRVTRGPDVACRFGGDEFVLVVAAASDEVPQMIERITAELAATAAPRLTFSAGVAERSPASEVGLDELIGTADRSMYQRKVLSRLRRDRQASSSDEDA
jgi:diguanylate cyclase (GGDEF)-like protein/PAS domain S-box-containing protein